MAWTQYDDDIPYDSDIPYDGEEGDEGVVPCPYRPARADGASTRRKAADTCRVIQAPGSRQ